MGGRLLIIAGVQPEKAEFNMEAKIYVGNLSKSTTQDELSILFAQAGEVTMTEVISDRKSGNSRVLPSLP